MPVTTLFSISPSDDNVGNDICVPPIVIDMSYANVTGTLGTNFILVALVATPILCTVDPAAVGAVDVNPPATDPERKTTPAVAPVTALFDPSKYTVALAGLVTDDKTKPSAVLPDVDPSAFLTLGAPAEFQTFTKSPATRFSLDAIIAVSATTPIGINDVSTLPPASRIGVLPVSPAPAVDVIPWNSAEFSTPDAFNLAVLLADTVADAFMIVSSSTPDAFNDGILSASPAPALVETVDCSVIVPVTFFKYLVAIYHPRMIVG
ncbi:hypothetical protein CCP3SC1_70071 [Gammaproteobacteria bacterium]